MLNAFQASVGAVSLGAEWVGEFAHVECAPEGEPVELWSNYSLDEFISEGDRGEGIDCEVCGRAIREASCIECGTEDDVEYVDDAGSNGGGYLCPEHKAEFEAPGLRGEYGGDSVERTAAYDEAANPED